VTGLIIIPALALMISASMKQSVLRPSLTFNINAITTSINDACLPNVTYASLSTIPYKDPVSLRMVSQNTLNENLLFATITFDKYTIDVNRVYPIGATVLSMIFVRRFTHSLVTGAICLLCTLICNIVAMESGNVTNDDYGWDIFREFVWVAANVLLVLAGSHMWEKSDRIKFLYTIGVETQVKRLRISLSKVTANSQGDGKEGFSSNVKVTTRLGSILDKLNIMNNV
jgi:hypothetical protein